MRKQFYQIVKVLFSNYFCTNLYENNVPMWKQTKYFRITKE